MAHRTWSVRLGKGGAIVVLCASPLFALDPQRPPSRYGHDAWLGQNGLPQEFVGSITQTRDGYLWIGTLGGLVRFDGVRFTVFDSSNMPGLKDARITALCPGRDGGLWIGTAAGGVSRLEGGVLRAFEPVSEAPDRSLKYVRSLVEAADGSLWIGTSGGGIRRFRDGRRLGNEEPASLGHTITALLQDRSGDVWIGSTTEGVARLSGGRVIRYRAQDALPDNFVHAIFEDRAGAIWIGTRGGLARIRDGRATSFTRKNGFPAEEARAIWEDRDHNLWVGTLGQGLVRGSGGKFVAAGPGSLSDDNVMSLFEDHEGSLWVGTQKGLNRLKDVAFTTFSRRDGLSHEQVNSLLRSRDDSVWVGTDGGGLNQLKHGRLRVFTVRDGLGSDYIGPLFESRDGSLWVGGDGFVSHLKGRRFTTYRTDPAGEGHFVSMLGEDAQGQLVVSIGNQPLVRFEAGRLVPYHPATGAGFYRFSMLRDREGALWFGTTEGLARFKDGGYTVYTEKDGLPDDTVHSVYQDAEGTLWIATIGGLCRFRDGRFVSFAGASGLGIGVVSQVIEDSTGHLWMNGRRGIVRVRKEDLDAYAAGRASSVPFTVYGTGDGLESADYNPSYIQAPACRTGDGRLWFATTKGVAFIDPLRLAVNPLPPPVVVERVLADDEEVPLLGDARARVQPGRKKFEFHYTALSFVSPEKVRFRYFLEGFDSAWTAAHERRTAYYTNLPPRRYRFRVKAANADGVWNEAGAAFAFELEPRFHQTRWFTLLVLGLLALGAWSLHRLRLGRIEARFAAVMGERNRMARELHDSLAQGLAGIALHAGALRRAAPELSSAGSRHLDTIGRLVESSLAEARGSVWDLHPESLRQRDLAEALRAMVRELTTDTPVKAGLELRGTPRPLGRQAERNIFRIGQEALTNALKHSEACVVEMVLSFERARVELRVRDNGRGFDPEAPAAPGHDGFGLRSMRQRAEQMGGRLSVNSRPGAGTEVVLEAPLS